MVPVVERPSTELSIEPKEALRRAVRSLEDGPADPRTVEGAKVNALESIAWSLIGLLARQEGSPSTPAAKATTSKDSLSGEIRSILGLSEPGR